MLTSYLNSIHYTQNDTYLRSVIFDADSLRRLLNDNSHGEIKHIKIMFAHTLDYINGGHADQMAKYRSGALTLIIAGYDDEGNYIYYPLGKVLNNGIPCPTSCPATGTATDDLLTN